MPVRYRILTGRKKRRELRSVVADLEEGGRFQGTADSLTTFDPLGLVRLLVKRQQFLTPLRQ